MHNRKLVLLALVFAFATALAWAPAAEAVAYCNSSYCTDKPAGTLCGCPPFTDRPGASATCGDWNRVGVCWYGGAALAAEEAAACAVEPAAPESFLALPAEL